MDLIGKNIVITGASSGIGLALAKELVRRNVGGLALMARREAPLKELAQHCTSKGVKSIALAVDVSNEDAVNSAVIAAEAALGPIQVGIANAGISVPHVATEPDNKLMRQVFEVNVFGAAYLMNALIPGMVSRGEGLLVGVGSIAGFRGLPGNGVYSASKAALANLLEAHRAELEPHGIGVTLVSPGYVQTPLLAKRSFETPFVVAVEDAAKHICDAMEKDKAHVVFPWQVGLIMGALSHLPQNVYRFVGRSLMAQRKKKR